MVISSVNKKKRLVLRSSHFSLLLRRVMDSLVHSCGTMASIRCFPASGILSSVNKILKNGSTQFQRMDGSLVNSQEVLNFARIFLVYMKITEMAILLLSFTTCSTFRVRMKTKNSTFRDSYLRSNLGLIGG